MAQQKNFLNRVVDAMIAGREREARQFVARFEREYGKTGRGPGRR